MVLGEALFEIIFLHLEDVGFARLLAVRMLHDVGLNGSGERKCLGVKSLGLDNNSFIWD